MFEPKHSEYARFAQVDPRRGMTSIEAAYYLTAAFPEHTDWLCWSPQTDCGISALASPRDRDEGRVGEWRWQRLPLDYPSLMYHTHQVRPSEMDREWTGLLKVTSPKGESFLLFSFLNSSGNVGGRYMISPARVDLMTEFNRAALLHYDRVSPGKIRVNVINGPPILVDIDREDRVYLPVGMQEDIEGQVEQFYVRPDVFAGLGLPHRRGILFVGPPGCGKTMMVRRIIRNSQRHGVMCWSIRGDQHAIPEHLDELVAKASQNAPGLIILEELDSLLHESAIDRSSMLSALDGLEPVKGVLIVATTNNPLKIDPAFLHRPSRFDRVWLFTLPTYELRARYLTEHLPEVAGELVEELAYHSDGWSYAYMNELKLSAAMVAMGRGDKVPTEDDLRQAHAALAAQFNSGRKNHAEWETKSTVGFS